MRCNATASWLRLVPRTGKTLGLKIETNYAVWSEKLPAKRLLSLQPAIKRIESPTAAMCFRFIAESFGRVRAC